MADEKPDRKPEPGPSAPYPGAHMAESSPNPHSEAKVVEMPIRTDHSEHTSRNVAQTSNTVDNRMNPSVVPEAGEAQVQNGRLEEVDRDALDSDSMFNQTDKQTRDILDPQPTDTRPGREGGGDVRDRNKKKPA